MNIKIKVIKQVIKINYQIIKTNNQMKLIIKINKVINVKKIHYH
jgi:hypothetical protein